jgi:hypothetical protein
MAAPREVRTLIQRFQGNRAAYVSGPYNETQLRREFLDPLLIALGWDVANVSGAAEAYKDVVHEDAIKIGGATKAPDYCFRIGGTRKFFVEAKRPSVRIKDDASSAYQLRRYAWSAKLPLSILTNFAELAVYDCRVKPERSDPASTARILYLTCDEYDARWDELAGIFTKEAVLKGSFDRFAESTKAKRGTAEVDTAFLKEIEAWRDELARNIALRNPELSQRELNFAVQRTIDRIIFLRICEDRGIEPYGGLQALLNGPNVYRRLGELFRRADERYNSGLFHFRPEKGRAEPPDELTLDLVVDDKVLKDILRRLYYPESPYEFSVLPADILGQVYEQFLGKVIRLTAGHRAVVEEKPEVRKAGGVYYTPTYIVDYIVAHTVGGLLEGKTPQEVGGFTKAWKPSAKLRPLRVLDPACGSGSFLLGAYQYLLDWHRKKYVEDGPEKHARGRNPRLYRVGLPSPAAGRGVGGEGIWRLTTAERKRILLTHIYGVDIDPQAVEVTKLSLLLKVLEGETHETLDSFYRLFQERALPDLGANIKCGNSLIGPDFFAQAEYSLLDEEERYRINPFDWYAEFPDVFSGDSPGFDAVIGNPPYLSYSGRQAVDVPPGERDYFNAHYSTGGWFTSHGMFIERAVAFLSQRFVGFIVPDQIGHLDGYAHVRKAVTRRAGIAAVRYWGEQVFKGVVTPALTLIADRVHDGPTSIALANGAQHHLRVAEGEAWVPAETTGLLQKLSAGASSLGRLVADPGVHTGNCSEKLIFPVGNGEGQCVPVLEGKQVSRYSCDRPRKVLRLDYMPLSGEYFTIRSKEKYAAAKFVIRQTAAYPIVGPREHAEYFRNSLLALYDPSDGTDVWYLVGLLNSRVLRYVYQVMVRESQQEAFPQVKISSLRRLPIRTIDFSDPADKARHDRMVSLVQTMLDLHKELAAAKTAHEKTMLQRQIAATDHQIDQLVYKLYGLTADEIKIVEEATTRA